ncbi:MAG TPA: hypothetical protein P5083_01150 [Candidatus Paceibacterota bacterium]|nr:hypothetical protein [Candidatus Paceibacterota bacterium]
MNDFLVESIMYLVIGGVIGGVIGLFLYIIRKIKLKSELELSEEEELIRKEYEEEEHQNFLKALEKFPSKHLVGKEKEWEEMFDKQTEYFDELNDISGKKIQEKYNLSAEDWECLKAKIVHKVLKESKKF